MRVCRGFALAMVVGFSMTMAWADDIKSGPDKKIGGAFDVNAITGEMKGKKLCYV